jgi:hypothetical protein
MRKSCAKVVENLLQMNRLVYKRQVPPVGYVPSVRRRRVEVIKTPRGDRKSSRLNRRWGRSTFVNV